MLEKCLTLLLLNLQGCYQSAMVARAMSLFRHKEDRGLCCPNAPPPAWGQSEDYRSITTTFQYLETSGISIKLLRERTDEIEMAVFHTDMRIPACLQAGIGVPPLWAKLRKLWWKNARGRSWWGTAIIPNTCWPCRWRPAADPPACALNTAGAPSGWTPLAPDSRACRPSRTSSAWCSTTWAQATCRRARHPAPWTQRWSLTRLTMQLRAAMCPWSWCSPCTNQEPSLL